jgi:hypothetical protein
MAGIRDEGENGHKKTRLGRESGSGWAKGGWAASRNNQRITIVEPSRARGRV